MALLPLLAGEIRVEDLYLRDIAVQLRPRPTPGQDYADSRSYFPTIRNRDSEALAGPSSVEKGGTLRLAIENIHVDGEHEFWVHHVRGLLPGELRGSFRLDTSTGQLGLSGVELDLALTELHIGASRDVTADAWIRGRIDVPPANFAELPTAEAIKLPEIDAELDVPLPDLHFVNLLFGTAGLMDISGKGRLRGRLVLSGGEQRIGTDLLVEAPELRLGLARFDFAGDGVVEMKSHETDDNQGDLSVRFGAVEAYLKSGTGRKTPRMFEGRDLNVTLHVDSSDSAKEKKADVQLMLSVPSMRVHDLALYNALIPEKWGVELTGGQGELSGHLVVDRQDLVMGLDLNSDETDVRFEDNHLTTDLSLALRAQAKADTGAHLDLAGTVLRLEDVRFGRAGAGKAKPWRGGLKIDEGHVAVPIPAERTGVDPLTYLTETLEEQGFGKLLENADGHLGATLTVSRLDWIADRLGRPLGLTLAGSGEIDAGLVLKDGRLGQGTKLRIPSRRLQLGMLEHRVDGQGQAALSVVKSGGESALQLNVEFADASVKRGNDERPEADKMRLKAEVLVPKSALEKGSGPVISLEIPSARIPDIGAFNAYLPSETPVKLLSGEASLIGDLQLAPDRATGELLIRTEDLRVGLNGEEFSGNIRLDILISDGAPKNLRFDVSGSQLALNAFRVGGKTASYDQPDWNAHLEIDEAMLVWKKPLHLEMRALTTITDTRPFPAILDNVRGKHGWIDGLLEAEDLAGHVELVLDGEQVVLSDAMIGSAKINVGVKGRTLADGIEGLVYVRWNNLTGALALAGEDRHFHLLDARGKFDAYVPGRTGLPGQEQAMAEGTAGSHEAGTVDTLASPETRKAATQQNTANPNDDTSGEDINPFLNEDL